MNKYEVKITVIRSTMHGDRKRYLVSIYRNGNLWNIPPSFGTQSMVRKYLRDMAETIGPHKWCAFYSVEFTQQINIWKGITK